MNWLKKLFPTRVPAPSFEPYALPAPRPAPPTYLFWYSMEVERARALKSERGRDLFERLQKKEAYFSELARLTNELEHADQAVKDAQARLDDARMAVEIEKAINPFGLRLK